MQSVATSVRCISHARGHLISYLIVGHFNLNIQRPPVILDGRTAAVAKKCSLFVSLHLERREVVEWRAPGNLFPYPAAINVTANYARFPRSLIIIHGW